MPHHRSTPTISEDVADRVRRLIHSGELSAGDRLRAERDLAADFGVARVSVREAIRLLAEGGYVTVRRGGQGGTFVAGLEDPYRQWLQQMRTRAGELDAILDLRVAVEGHAAYLAAQRCGTDEVDGLRAALTLMATATNRSSFRLADSHFHAGVGGAARSPRLKDLVEQARGDYFVPADKLIYEEQIEASLDGHTRVVEAIQHADADAARSAMVDHIELTRTHFHRLIRGEPLHQPASGSRPVPHQDSPDAG